MRPDGARHAAPDRDRLDTVLTTRWAALHLVGIGTLGPAIHQQQIVNDDRPGHAAAAPDNGSAACCVTLTDPPTVADDSGPREPCPAGW
jgi:hypothetical protein